MVQVNTYTAIWSKYLPVIRILLKKTLAAEQTLNLNVPDFERAGMVRKTGYKFVLKLKNAKVENVIVDSPLASSLASLLLQDPVVKEFCQDKEIQISMNPKFQLSLKNVTSDNMVSSPVSENQQ